MKLANGFVALVLAAVTVSALPVHEADALLGRGELASVNGSPDNLLAARSSNGYDYSKYRAGFSAANFFGGNGNQQSNGSGDANDQANDSGNAKAKQMANGGKGGKGGNGQNKASGHAYASYGGVNVLSGNAIALGGNGGMGGWGGQGGTNRNTGGLNKSAAVAPDPVLPA